MKQINIEEIILSKNPDFLKNAYSPVRKLVYNLIRKLLHISSVNNFLEKNQNLSGTEFISEALEFLDFTFRFSQKDMERIPGEGRLIVIANHPLGGLDGLLLLALITRVRKDVRIVVNDVLLSIDNLNEYFLPVDLVNKKSQMESIRNISQALLREEAVIIFPAGEVSRLSLNGIRDSKWTNSTLYFAQKFNAPVLPVHIQARNSMLFYFASLVYKKVSTFLLPREIFNKRGKSANIFIGNPIPAKSFQGSIKNDNLQTKLLKKHLYRIGSNKKEIFITEKNIVHPVDRKLIKNELSLSRKLLSPAEGQSLYVVESRCVNITREIARLREVTFRRVGEGTGSKKDSDIYDHYYKHIVLWDDEALEIIGSYRLGLCRELHKINSGFKLYSQNLFDFSPELQYLLTDGVELGRSFIQAKYWNSSALDFLWQGIGAYISEFSNIQYLFGPVSISSSYSQEAIELLVYYYSKWYGGNNKILPKMQFIIQPARNKELSELFNAGTYKSEFKQLKTYLKQYGFTVPVLFKQYTLLAEPDGVSFLGFNIDPDFQFCIDGFILINLYALKQEKKDRYLVPNRSDLVQLAENPA